MCVFTAPSECWVNAAQTAKCTIISSVVFFSAYTVTAPKYLNLAIIDADLEGKKDSWKD